MYDEDVAIHTANVEDSGFPCQLVMRDALQKMYVAVLGRPSFSHGKMRKCNVSFICIDRFGYMRQN